MTVVFFLDGVAIASWAPHIPTVQDDLGLGTGALGLALLGLPVGALIAQPLTGWLAASRGSRRLTAAGVIAVAVALPLPGFAPDVLALGLALACVGAATGALDVAMNVHGAEVEERLGRSIMSSLHSAYSIGALAGAANGALAAAAGVAPGPHLLATGAAIAVVGVPATRRLLPVEAAGRPRLAAFARPSRALLALGALGFCAALVEGAALDWSAVYLDDSGASRGLAGAGFVAFAAAWTTVRLVGDRLVDRFGAPAVVRVGCLVGAAGLAGGLATGGVAGGIAGFAVLGAGIGSVFPLMVSAASRAPGLPSGMAIASVTTTAYLGFLVGPPLIGFLAEATELRFALALLVALCVVAGLLAPATRPGARA